MINGWWNIVGQIVAGEIEHVSVVSAQIGHEQCCGGICECGHVYGGHFFIFCFCFADC